MTQMGPSTKNMRPSLTDVGKAAGVSPATVSFVLNNTPGQTISSATRSRVMEAVRVLRYKPNASARALARGHTNEIAAFNFGALYLAGLLDWISAIQARTLELGYTPGIYLYQGASRRAMRSYIDSVLARHPVGLISESPYFTKADLARAKDMGVRGCVVIGIEPAGSKAAFTGPFKEAGQLVGNHLLERGHQRIAYAKPVSPTPTQQAAWSQCIKGLERTVKRGQVTLTELPMDTGLESARVAVDRLLAFPERPTAVLGFPEYSLPFLKALLEHNIRVPEEIAVVAVVDTYLCSLVHPALTSVHIDTKTMASNFVDIADALIRNQQPSPALFVPPPPQLIIRESS
jgi:DNA-binding LacI/PurR family transcriptional regulator